MSFNDNNNNRHHNNYHHNHHRDDNHMRNMYVYNSPPCPWQGPNDRQMFPNGPPPGPAYNGNNRQMVPNGPPRPPPFNGQPRHQGPYPGGHYNMMPPCPGPNWQGPGPSRPRNRGYRSNRGVQNRHQQNNNNNRQVQPNQQEIKDVCCKCGEDLQNCGEPGIHMCDGGNHVPINDNVADSGSDTGDSHEVKEEELDARLEKLLVNLKDFMRSKYKTVTEALEDYVSGKIEEINTLHRENTEEKSALVKLKKELEDKAKTLEKQEKELREKQKRFTKDQDTFTRDMKKEKEEICRRWQELRDEIVRMEETHETQKGRIKLDVGGNVFTTSMLTLTRESDSMLAAMFSGRHDILKEEDGCVFIDRDGTHFRYVLNYLRDGGVNMECLPKDRQLLKELRKEAIYYNLHGLLQQVEKCLY